MIELYDVGRVITGPFEDGYRFIAEQGEKYIDDKVALERIRAFHKDRKLGISQEDFNWLNQAWVQAIKKGELPVNPAELVYRDVKPRFEKVRARGDLVWLLTSGSVELTDLLIRDEAEYDEVLVGEDIGDKNHPETYAKVWDIAEGNVNAFFDDKPSALQAAYEGFRMAGGNPSLYFVDRDGIVPQEKIKKLESRGIIRIISFDRIRD